MNFRRATVLLLSGAFVAATVALIHLGAAAGSPPAARGAPPEPADHSLSPYFVVEGAKPGAEALPLESTHADIHIAGVIASVVVHQTYRNRGSVPISARYVFPASTRAAVNGMKMKVGDRVITAKVEERKAARRAYEKAKKAGKTASLLEEQRPNVFSMRVANILPGDKIQVELRYTELLVPTDGVYALVYPAVVGPRYAGGGADPRAPQNQFAASPYTHQGHAPTYAFGLNVSVDAGMPIQSIASPSDTIRTHWNRDHTRAEVALAAGDKTPGNRDFVLDYRLSGSRIQSGLLIHRGAKENFFLAMVQPPRRPPPDLIPPREYVFVLDVSGSMWGFPLKTAKRLMAGLLARLRPSDRFDVELFSGGSSLYNARSVAATPAHIKDALAFIDRQRGGGGTELLPALQRAMALPQPDAGISRSFVVVTDGYIITEPKIFQYVRDHLGEANVFAFGVGTAVNRYLIDGLARAGRGEPFVVLNAGQADAAATRLRAYIESPVLTDVQVSFHGFDAYDVQPAQVPDVFAQRPVVLFGKWRGSAAGTVEVSGVSGHGRFVAKLDVAKAAGRATDTEALPYLWARSRIADLADFGRAAANRKQVIDLGLRYNLLTQFTSFVAIEQRVRSDGSSADVDQPLPMPQGVNDAAVGGVQGGAEPPLLWPLALVLAAAAWQWLRWARARRAA